MGWSVPILLLGAVIPLWGGPLEKGRIAACADWVVHVDAEALHDSTLGRVMREHPEQFRTGWKVAGAWGAIDPWRDIRSLTVYGSEAEDGCGMAIVVGTAAIEALADRLIAEGQCHNVEAEGMNFYEWSEGGRTWVATIRPGTAPDERVVYLAESREQLRAGLRVAEGGEPSWSPTGPGPAPGSVLYVEAARLPRALQAPEQAGSFLRLVRALRLDMGESGGEIYAEVALTAPAAEQATAMLQAAQGFVALGRLTAQRNPRGASLAWLCDALRLSADGPVVSVRMRVPAGTLLKALSIPTSRPRGESGTEHGGREPSLNASGGR